jgi:hypothetical protein
MVCCCYATYLKLSTANATAGSGPILAKLEGSPIVVHIFKYVKIFNSKQMLKPSVYDVQRLTQVKLSMDLILRGTVGVTFL